MYGIAKAGNEEGTFLQLFLLDQTKQMCIEREMHKILVLVKNGEYEGITAKRRNFPRPHAE